MSELQDPRLRWNDGKMFISTFHETATFEIYQCPAIISLLFLTGAIHKIFTDHRCPGSRLNNTDPAAFLARE